MRLASILRAVFAVLAIATAGCGSATLHPDGGGGTGGGAGRGGSAGGRGGIGGTGGAATGGTGGAGAGTGGTSGISGTSGTGGTNGTSGTGGTSGVSGRGGTTGGAGATGGASGAGGVGATGGASGTGGVSGRGGTTGGTGGSNAGGGGRGGTNGGTGGSGGTGGTGGTGRGLGQSCSGDQQCTSGHCAGSVCCDQACTGPCQQCSSAGACQMPADDPVCGAITCPIDTNCRDYATAISTNRCKTLGQCKTSADCSYVDAPNTRMCGYVRAMTELAPAMCDGLGNCKGHSVNCGGDGACAISDAWCCATSGLSCQVDECGGTPKLGPYLCDAKADCAAGYICCLQSTVGGPSSICLPSTPSSLCSSDTGGQRAQACNPAATPSECSTGTCQATSFGPVGWYNCAP